MSKWKCEICSKDFVNFHAQGFDNKIYCPLCFFKEKSIRLQQENQQLKASLELYENGVIYSSEVDELKERIEKAIEYIETWNCPECDKETMREICFNSSKEDLLEILKGDSNE